MSRPKPVLSRSGSWLRVQSPSPGKLFMQRQLQRRKNSVIRSCALSIMGPEGILCGTAPDDEDLSRRRPTVLTSRESRREGHAPYSDSRYSVLANKVTRLPHTRNGVLIYALPNTPYHHRYTRPSPPPRPRIEPPQREVYRPRRHNYKLTADVSANASSLAATGHTYQVCTIEITAPTTPIGDAMLQCTAHDNPRRGGVIAVSKGRHDYAEVLTATQGGEWLEMQTRQHLQCRHIICVLFVPA